MKYSRFLFDVHDGQNHILYNTLNGSIIVLSEEEYVYYDKQPQCGELTRLGFLVQDSVDEKKWFLEKLNSEMNSDKSCCIHLLPTTGCNFACRYCYQNGISRNYSFTPEDSYGLIEKIDKWVESKGIENLNLVLHGGEPTLNWSFVEVFLPLLDKMAGTTGVKYSTQIITNGYLLDRKKIQLLKRFHCDRVQITLDGPKTIHDSRRHLVDGSGTFDIIVENIKVLIEEDVLEHVSIRVNYDKRNHSWIKELLQYLESEFETDKIDISFGLVTPTIIDFEYEFIEENEVSKKYLDLYITAKQLGFRTGKIYVHDGFCSAKAFNSIIISPDGFYYKCLSTVGRSDCAVGSIKDDISSFSMVTFDRYERCLSSDCPWVPICHTGCLFESLCEFKSLEAIKCNRQIIENVNKVILKEDVSHINIS